MRGNAHVRFGGRPGETDRPKRRHRAPGPPNHVKVRDRSRVVSKALVIAYAVSADGVREVIGLDLGEVESEGSGWSSCARCAPAAWTACSSSSPTITKG